MLSKLRKHTVWAKDYWGPDREAERFFVSVLLPLYDLVVIVAGALVVAFGLPTMETIFSPPLVDLLGYIVVVSGAVCLVGVSFPTLWRVEVYGKGVLVGAIISYSLSLFVLGLLGLLNFPDVIHQPGRFAASAIVLLALFTPAARMKFLAIEARKRKNAA